MGFPVLNAMALNGQISISAQDSIELATTADGSYDPMITPGTIIEVDVATYGVLELIRLRVPADAGVAAYSVGSIFTWDYLLDASIVVAEDANSSKPVGFSAHPITVDAVYDQYAWFVIGGSWPVYCNASITAGNPLGVIDDGQGGAVSAGLQVENSYVSAAATTTITHPAYTKLGSATILVNEGVFGWFVGGVVTGTAITGTVKVSAIDPDNRTVTLDTACTASGVSDVILTYNDGTKYWNLATFDRPHLQGQDAVAAP